MFPPLGPMGGLAITQKARARGQPRRGFFVCNWRKKPFGFNATAWARLRSQLFVFACLGLFPRERHASRKLIEFPNLILEFGQTSGRWSATPRLRPWQHAMLGVSPRRLWVR